MAKFCQMLAHFTQSQLLIAVSVLTSSFLGSLHCLGMCGPIVIATNKTKLHSLLYQLGRMMGYLLLGYLVAILGQELLGSFPSSFLSKVTPAFLGGVFILMGILLIKKRKFHIPMPSFVSIPYSKFVSIQTKNHSFIFPFIIGFCSILLPCGWLYGFVIGAATTENVSTSLLIMFMFWLGTVPALFFTPIIFQRIINPMREKFPLIASAVLIFAGMTLILITVTKVL